MSAVALQAREPSMDLKLPAALDRRFEAVVFDWDGTAVPDRSADASELRALVEELCALGLDLSSSPARTSATSTGSCGPGRRARGGFYFCVNRGSEVYEADAGRPASCSSDAQATPAEEAALDAAAAATVAELARRGVDRGGGLAAAEPAQDRPDPGAGVGRSAEGADR